MWHWVCSVWLRYFVGARSRVFVSQKPVGKPKGCTVVWLFGIVPRLMKGTFISHGALSKKSRGYVPVSTVNLWPTKSLFCLNLLKNSNTPGCIILSLYSTYQVPNRTALGAYSIYLRGPLGQMGEMFSDFQVWKFENLWKNQQLVKPLQKVCTTQGN